MRYYNQSVDIENDFEYVFNKKGNNDDLLDFSNIEEDDSDQEDTPKDKKVINKKKKITKKRMELAFEDDKEISDKIVNN